MIHPFPRYKIASRAFQRAEDDEDDDEGEEDDRLFEVDDKGRLIVNGHLDREEKASHSITITTFYFKIQRIQQK